MKFVETPVWAWCTFRAWRPLGLGRDTHSKSGMTEWEGAKNTRVGRSMCRRDAHSGRVGRFRLRVGQIYSSRKFAEVPCGRGARSEAVLVSHVDVVHFQDVEAAFA